MSHRPSSSTTSPTSITSLISTSTHHSPTATGSFPLTLITPDPNPIATTYATDPIENNQPDKLSTILIIIICIGLLGFGIGYLRLRQMRRIGRRQLAHSNSDLENNNNHSTTMTTTTVPDSTSRKMPCTHLNATPLPIYSPASPSTTLIAPSNGDASPHHHPLDTPPSYQEHYSSKEYST